MKPGGRRALSAALVASTACAALVAWPAAAQTPQTITVVPAAAPAWDPLPQVAKSRIKTGPFAGGYLVGPAGYLNWYFANLGLFAFVDRIPAEVRQYLDLFLAHMDADATIQDVVFANPYDPGSAGFTLRPQDSDDSYAATFLSLAVRYTRVTGDRAWFLANTTKLKEIAYRSLALAEESNGLIHTFQSQAKYDVCYTEDNCEDWKGLTDFAGLLKDVGDADASYYAAVAAPVATAIAQIQFLQGPRAFSVAYNGAANPLGAKLYPDGVTQIFPQAYRLPVPSSENDDAWSYLEAHFPGFEDGRYDSSPFLVASYAAALRGERAIALAGQKHLRDLLATHPDQVAIHDLGFYERITQVLNGGAPY